MGGGIGVDEIGRHGPNAAGSSNRPGIGDERSDNPIAGPTLGDRLDQRLGVVAKKSARQ